MLITFRNYEKKNYEVLFDSDRNRVKQIIYSKFYTQKTIIGVENLINFSTKYAAELSKQTNRIKKKND